MDGGIGQPIRRKEDRRLLTGNGRYTDDVSIDGQAYAHILRADHANARIKRIDVTAARALRGVLAVYTCEDYRADGHEPAMAAGPTVIPPDVLDPPNPGLIPRPGTENRETPLFPFADETVHRVGEIIAVVVAESLAVAKDAAELIGVDYEPLPVIVDPAEAVAPGAPLVWDHVPRNTALEMERGDSEATAAAFAGAAHRVKLRLRNQRVALLPMEPRAQVVDYDPDGEQFTFYCCQARTFLTARDMARALDVPPERIRVVRGDVGGSFGNRYGSMHENILTAWAARKLERPVKWTCERSEGMISDFQARELDATAELALDDDGRFLGFRVSLIYNTGAVAQMLVPLSNGVRLVTGSYRVPTAYVEGKAVVTNTTPTAVYRGAGRPEAIYNFERLIDAAAAQTGIDRVEIRRRNLISPDELPYTSPVGVPYDSGDFEIMMDKVLRIADWDGFAARRQQSEARGLCRGISVANYIQNTTGHPAEWTALEVLPEGRVEIAMGVDPSGQGHETSFAQVLTEWLGVPFDSITLRTGDTDVVKGGSGSQSDRSMRIGGKIMVEASNLIIDKGKKIAAHALEVAVADIEFRDGTFTVMGTDRRIGIFDVAKVAADPDASGLPEELAGPLREEVTQKAYIPGYPSGAAVCEVEVDPATGNVDIVAYSSVDDVGRAINPLIVDGQTAGAIAQGIGQAAMEELVYDPESGQLLSGSLMDYALPRADDLPFYGLELHEVPAPSNTLGVKGGGEGGVIPALATYINAIIDALRDFGVTDLEMPATPEKVWRAIQDAKSA